MCLLIVTFAFACKGVGAGVTHRFQRGFLVAVSCKGVLHVLQECTAHAAWFSYRGFFYNGVSYRRRHTMGLPTLCRH